MAGSRYTRQQLFTLRNQIPIDRLMEALTIPSSSHEGHYRFRCPVCSEFNTGINPKTNLARCFSCQKNYNTIDLVMAVKRLGFIDSAAYLERLKTVIEFPVPKTDHPRKAVRQNKMLPLSDIFKSLASDTTPAQPHNYDQTISHLQNRVSDLESHVKSLTRKIALIKHR